jgi:hypothetical protein
MAIGDAAAAAGMDLVPGTTPAKDIDTEINKTRDYVAERTAEVMPLAKGGTGATTPGAARTNLGIVAANIPTSTPGSSVQADLNYVGGLAGSASSAAASANANANNRLLQSVGDQIYLGQLAPAVYARNLFGTRRGAWVQDDGTLGYASSKRAYKQDFEVPEWTVEQMIAIPILHYRRRKAVAAERRGEGRAATEIGTIADAMHDLGLWEFVIYDGRGDDAVPVGVHYELLSLAALWLAQETARRMLAAEDRLAALEARLAPAE